MYPVRVTLLPELEKTKGDAPPPLGSVKFRTAAELVPEFDTAGIEPVVVVPTVTVAAVPAGPVDPGDPWAPVAPVGPAGRVNNKTGRVGSALFNEADPVVPDGTVATGEETESVGEVPLAPFVPLVPAVPAGP